MRVAIDARWIFPTISGVGAYTRELLAQFCAWERELEYLALFSDPAVAERTVGETNLRSAPNFRSRIVPYGVFSPAGQWRLPRLLREERCDLFHSPNYMIPLAGVGGGGRLRCVTTIHDAIPLVVRDHAPRSRKARVLPLYRAIMRRIGRQSDAILTVSHCSRRDILRELRIPAGAADKVHVVYNGVSPVFSPSPAGRPAPAPAQPRRLLYVGRADPYKNVPLLVRVLADVRRRTGAEVTLTLAGPRDTRYPEAEMLAAELGLAGAVRWTGALPTAQLVEEYRCADVLVHPSRYEGFGLQVLEAMACGLPVVCSNAASLPEVAGDAAILVAPDDVGGYTAAVLRVLGEAGLAAGLSRRGLERARAFSWERTARETLDVYRRTAEGGRR